MYFDVDHQPRKIWRGKGRVRPLSYPILVHPPPFTTLAGKALQTHPTLYHYPTQEHSIKMEEEKSFTLTINK